MIYNQNIALFNFKTLALREYYNIYNSMKIMKFSGQCVILYGLMDLRPILK